jgi:DNA-binding CsgD family transcriptional regulator
MPNSALVESMYEAAFVPERWSGVLDRLCELSESASGTLLLFDGVTDPRWKTTRRTRELLETLSRTDAWKRRECSSERLIQASAGDQHFHCVDDLMTRRQLELDVSYSAFREHGLGWRAGTAIPMPTGDTIMLSFEREIAQGRHSAEQLARLSGFRTHLGRAGLIASRLGLERAHSALQAMDAIGIPAALVDRAGRLREVNAWVTPQLIGTRADDRIVLGDPAGDALLADILRSELEARSIALLPNAQLPGRIAHVIPLAGAALDIFSGRLWLLVMSVSKGSYRRPDPAILRALFNLSPAESRLVTELARGTTLSDAAILCNIQPSTARAYLEQIFRKTGCHRQIELVSLLAGLTHVASCATCGHRDDIPIH